MTTPKKTAEFDYREFLLGGDRCKERLEQEQKEGEKYASQELSDLQKRQFSSNA